MHDLLVGDCREILKDMPSKSVDMILTDPPYFLDGFDNKWSKGKQKANTQKGIVGGLPVGMKFSKNQGKQLQNFMSPIAEELHRVLKPGGFCLVFSFPRLVHRMGVAFEDASFEIRDLYAWEFSNKSQTKAFSHNHFVKNKKNLSEEEKEEILASLVDRKTPQFGPRFESIICAKKENEGTFVDNWIKYKLGFIDVSVSKDMFGTSPSTLIKVNKEDKPAFNYHLTTKPVQLCKYFIETFTCPGQVVLDPFVGSGTTSVAAKLSNRSSIGIDIFQEYIDICNTRLEQIK